MAPTSVRRTVLLLGVLSVSGIAGCGVEFDPGSVRPTAVAPASTVVEAVNVPYDSNLPKYVIAVEPVQFAGTLTERYTVIQGASADESREQRNNNVKGSRQGTLANDSAVQAGAAVNVDRQGQPGQPPAFTNAVLTNATAPGGTIRGSAGLSRKDTIRNEGLYSSTSSGSTNRSGSSESERSVYESVRVTTPDPQAIRIAAQLTSALSGVENFSLRDITSIRRGKDGAFSTALNEGEVGPFIVKALITEYNPDADIEKLKVHVLPGTKWEEQKKVGVVVLDVSIVDGRDGSVVSSYPAAGTFQWGKKGSDVGLIFSVYSEDKQARSVMDNALRAALNDAAGKALTQLSERAN